MPRFVLNETSYHGKGAIQNLVPEINARGFKKVFACADPDLIKLGIDENKLIKENDSLTTVQNAYYSAPIIKKLGAEVVIICTSPYHLGDPRYKAMESFINELKDTNIAVMCYTRNL
mgnify:CR=1 FL=1